MAAESPTPGAQVRPDTSPAPPQDERSSSDSRGPGSKPASKSSPILAILARWVLGAAFVYMGMHKVLAPSEFLGLVRQYNLTNNSFILNSIAAALPWFEVF